MSTTKTSGIVQPYLFFDGRCDEAIDFYRKALDAEVTTLLRSRTALNRLNPACAHPVLTRR
jgi:PhnB protein